MVTIMQVVSIPVQLGDAIKVSEDAGLPQFATGVCCRFYLDAVADNVELTMVRCVGPASEEVSDVVTEFMVALLKNGAVAEDDMEEPLDIGMDMGEAILASPVLAHASPVLAHGDDEPPSSGGLSPREDPVPGPSARDIAEHFGARTQFRLGGLSIHHADNGSDGHWFALKVEELRDDDGRASQLDAHFTLFYLRSHREHSEPVAAALTAMLQQITDRRGELPVDFVGAGVISPLSTEAFAMIDLLVSSRAHQSLHSLSHHGLSRVPMRHKFFLHRAFHLSIRRSEDTRFESF